MMKSAQVFKQIVIVMFDRSVSCRWSTRVNAQEPKKRQKDQPEKKKKKACPETGGKVGSPRTRTWMSVDLPEAARFFDCL